MGSLAQIEGPPSILDAVLANSFGFRPSLIPHTISLLLAVIRIDTYNFGDLEVLRLGVLLKILCPERTTLY